MKTQKIFAVGLIFTIFGHIFAEELYHNCIHDEIIDTFKLDEIIPHKKRIERSLEEQVWQPMRIHVNFDRLPDMGKEKTHFVKSRLFPAAIKFFEGTLSVVRYSDLLKTSRTSCLKAQIPAYYNNHGVKADLIIMVSSINQNVLAASGTCDFGEDYRPILGCIQINPSLVDTNSSAWPLQLTTLKHEITHILGFSRGTFPKWKNPSVLKTKLRGTERLIINSTRVTEVARRYFNCSTLIGVELEDQGGAGSVGSHWERRVLGSEAMTPTNRPTDKYSSFTLALLEDSGWYKANYSNAAPLNFGKGRDCSFIYDTCIDNQKNQTRFPEFCDIKDEQACSSSSDYTFKGVCKMNTASSSIYKYFGKNIYGSDAFSDECPYITPYRTGDCTDSSQTSSPFYPEKFGSSSRCFQGTLFDENRPANDTIQTGCFPFKCKLENNIQRLYVTLGDYDYQCPFGGGPITQVLGYSGYLTCPPESNFCDPIYQIIDPNKAVDVDNDAAFLDTSDNSINKETQDYFTCPNFCFYRGTCKDGVCICSPGFVGEDCNTPYCLDGCFYNTSQGGCDNKGNCQCNDGWGGANCNELTYKLNCDRCEGATPDCVGNICDCFSTPERDCSYGARMMESLTFVLSALIITSCL